jgi:hypothetical protein
MNLHYILRVHIYIYIQFVPHRKHSALQLTGETGKLLIYQPNYAPNKMHSEASLKLLHVSASGSHHQGAILNKEIQSQRPC